MVDTGASIAVTTGTDFEVEGTVDLVFFCAVNSCEMFGHCYFFPAEMTTAPLSMILVVSTTSILSGGVGVGVCFVFCCTHRFWPFAL